MEAGGMEIDPRLIGGDWYGVQESSDEEETGDEATSLGYNPQLTDDVYSRELDRERRQKKTKLRTRFESIFEKYGKDFEGVGDEIDLKTGLIVVDNGHLKNMQHEADAGHSTSLETTQAFPENSQEDVSGSGESGSDAGSEGDWGDAEDHENDEQTSSSRDASAGPENILEQMPSLKDSVRDLQSKRKQGQGIDNNAIQALGMSIAKQLADLMSRDDVQKTPKPKKSNNPLWNYPDIPAPPQAEQRKRKSRSPSPMPETTGPSPNQKSLWAPMKHPKPHKRKRVGEASANQPGEDGNAMSANEDNSNREAMDKSQEGERRTCYNCKCSDSMIWRNGPDGLLCNVCGMYWYRYGLIRPLEPPEESEESSSEESEDVAPQYSANTSRYRTHEITKHSRFEDHEDVTIIKLKEVDRLAWEKIAKYLPGRTPYAVQCRYSKKLHRRATEARAALANQGYEFQLDDAGLIVFEPAPQPKAFTDEEDELLLKLREEDGLEWEQCADSFPGRTGKALELRFNQLEKKLLSRHPNKSKRKRKKARFNVRFSAEEDALLKKLREVDKLSWLQVAENFPGRNALSLQKRYVREVAEKGKQRMMRTEDGFLITVADENYKYTRYSPEEDELIVHLREQLKLSWRQMELHFPGRDRYSVNSRYQYLQSKKDLIGKPQILETETEQDMQQDQDASKDGGQSEDELHSDDIDESLSVLTYPDPEQSSHEAIDVSPHDTDVTTGTDKQPQTTKRDASRDNEEFSQAEDDLIMQRWEIGGLSLEDIGAHLPGRSAVSVLSRYYNVLQPRKEAEPPSSFEFVNLGIADGPDAANVDDSALTASTTPPMLSGTQRWTKEEGDLLQSLREQNLEWDEIARRMPGRTLRALKGHHSTFYGKKRSSWPSGGSQRKDTNLLRQAVDNNVRRHSGTPNRLFVPTSTPTKRNPFSGTTVDLTGDVDEITSPAFKSVQSWYPQQRPTMLLPSAMPRNRAMPPDGAWPVQRKEDAPPKKPSPQNGAVTARYVASTLRKAPRSHNAVPPPVNLPKPPRSHTAVPPPLAVEKPPRSHTSVPPPMTHAQPQTPRRAQETPPPTFNPPPNLSPSGKSSQDTSPTSNPTPAKSTNYLTPVRYSQQAHPYYVAPPPPMSSMHRPFHDELVAGDSTTTAEERFGPRLETHHQHDETSTARPRDQFESRQESQIQPQPVSQPQRRLIAPKKKQPEPSRRSSTQWTAQSNVFDIPESDIIQVTDDEPLAVDYSKPAEEEQQAVAGSAPGDGEPTALDESDLVDEEMPAVNDFTLADEEAQTMNDSKPADEDMSVIDDHSNLADEELEASDNDVNDKNESNVVDPKESTMEHEPPLFSWIDLATMALKSKSPQPMRTKEICAYLADKFPYFQHMKTTTWKDRIRYSLCTCPEFLKVSDDFAALWGLKGAVEGESVADTGVTRRSKPGRPRKIKNAKDPNEPPKKRGRPPGKRSKAKVSESETAGAEETETIDLTVEEEMSAQIQSELSTAMNEAPKSDVVPDSEADAEGEALLHGETLPDAEAMPDDEALPDVGALSDDVALPDDMDLSDDEILPDEAAPPEDGALPESVPVSDGAALPDSEPVLDAAALPEHAAQPQTEAETNQDDDDIDELATPELTTRVRSSSHIKTQPKTSKSKPSSTTKRRPTSKDPQISSDLTRDPESSSSTPSQLPPSSEQPNNPLPSSSPILRKPAAVRGRRYSARTSTTPGTDRSTLFGGGGGGGGRFPPQHPGVSALKGERMQYRSSSVGVPGSSRRVVWTPVRDEEGSDDELA